jgi:hypothetical protein
LPARRFVLTVLAAAALCLVLAYAAHAARARSVTDVLLLDHQRKKLEDPALSGTQIVVVGDSCAGYAMHAPTFSKLSGMPTQSLALTGRFGFLGDYILMQQAKQAWPELHTVIVMHTLDIWRRRTSANAFTRLYSPAVDLSLVRGRERGWLERFKVQTNLREIGWYVEGLFAKPQPLLLSEESGYVVQPDALFATGEKSIAPNESLRAAIHPDKVAMFGALDRMGERLGLRLIYVHGPIHEVVGRNSADLIEEVNAVLTTARSMRALPDVTAYPDAMMGNRTDHVYEPAQREVTRHFFDLVEDHLGRPARSSRR